MGTVTTFWVFYNHVHRYVTFRCCSTTVIRYDSIPRFTFPILRLCRYCSFRFCCTVLPRSTVVHIVLRFTVDWVHLGAIPFYYFLLHSTTDSFISQFYILRYYRSPFHRLLIPFYRLVPPLYHWVRLLPLRVPPHVTFHHATTFVHRTWVRSFTVTFDFDIPQFYRIPLLISTTDHVAISLPPQIHYVLLPYTHFHIPANTFIPVLRFDATGDGDSDSILHIPYRFHSTCHSVPRYIPTITIRYIPTYYHLLLHLIFIHHSFGKAIDHRFHSTITFLPWAYCGRPTVRFLHSGIHSTICSFVGGRFIRWFRYLFCDVTTYIPQSWRAVRFVDSDYRCSRSCVPCI